METVFDIDGINALSTLSSSQLQAFYDRMKTIVWVISVRAKYTNCRDEYVSYGTGFSVSNDGLIMTCAHILQGKILSMGARRLHETRFSFGCQIVERKVGNDIALLKVNNVSDCNYGRFAIDGSISAGQYLLHIGNPSNFAGSVLTGRAAFPCFDQVTIHRDDILCNDFSSQALSRSCPHRIMGDIFNSQFFELKDPDKKTYYLERRLNPFVPIIQVSGTSCAEGCSGGPVFNSMGEIVGLMCVLTESASIAVHVSSLKPFLEENTKRVPPCEKGGTSKASKDVNKRKRR